MDHKKEILANISTSLKDGGRGYTLPHKWLHSFQKFCISDLTEELCASQGFLICVPAFYHGHNDWILHE